MAIRKKARDLGIPSVLPVVTNTMTYSPVFSASLGTVTPSRMWYQQNNDAYTIGGRFGLGTTTSAEGTWTLPNGYSADFTNVYSGPEVVVGRWYRAVSGATTRKGGDIIIRAASPTLLTFASDDYTTAANPSISLNASTVGVSGDIVYIAHLSVIILELFGQGYRANGAGQATADRSGLVSRETSGTISASFTGPRSQAVSIPWNRVGSIVTLEITTSGLAASTAAQSFTAAAGTIPAGLRPKAITYDQIWVQDNGSDQNTPGNLYIGADGSIIIGKLFASAAFTASGNCGFYRKVITYSVV